MKEMIHDTFTGRSTYECLVRAHSPYLQFIKKLSARIHASQECPRVVWVPSAVHHPKSKWTRTGYVPRNS